MEAAIAAGSVLVGNVVDWGWEQLQSLWAEVPALAGEAIVQAGADALAEVAIGGVGSLINWVTGGIEDIAWIPDWVKSAFTTFSANVGEALGTIATGAVSMARKGALDILEVTGAQERYMEQLQTSLETTFDAILTKLEVGKATNWTIGEDGIRNLTESLTRNVQYSYDQAAEFLRSTQIGVSGQMEGMRDFAYNTLGTTFLTVQQAGRIAIEMIDKNMSGVDTYLNEAAIGEAERYLETIRDTIIVPVATAEAFQWALSNVDPITKEALKDTIVETMIVQHEVAIEMAEKQLTVPEPRP